MTVLEVCEFCGVTRPTVYNWIKKGHIKPTGKKGNQMTFDQAAIEKFMENPPRRGRPKAAAA